MKSDGGSVSSDVYLMRLFVSFIQKGGVLSFFGYYLTPFRPVLLVVMIDKMIFDDDRDSRMPNERMGPNTG